MNTRHKMPKSMTAAIIVSITLTATCMHNQKEVNKKPTEVVTILAETTNISSAQRYSATIDAAEGSTLSFGTIGTVKKVYVREGQHVGKGALLAEVDNEQASSTYAAAKATLAQAEDAYERTKPLYEKGVIAKIKWIEIETKVQQAASAEAIARKALSDAQIISPCSGYVADLNVESGQQAVMGIPVMRIVNTERMKVEFSVPEQEVGRFKEGMTLILRVAALEGEEFKATVSEVGMVADRLSRTYKVSATLPNRNHQLRVGMLGEVQVVDGEQTAMTVPATAIGLDADGSRYVWVVEGETARKQKITTGAYVDNSVVVEGLAAGTHLIVKGQQKISNGMKVAEQLENNNE